MSLSKINDKPLIGKEPTMDESIEYWYDIVFDINHRSIECPICGMTKWVEPDATYIYKCEGCGEDIQVPTPEI